MSGPAGSRDHQPRGTSAQANDRIRRNARSPERAQESRAFQLTKTYMEAGNSRTTRRRRRLMCFSLRVRYLTQNLAEEFGQFRPGPSREELNHMFNLPQ